MNKQEAIKWVNDRMCEGRGTFTENHPPIIDECWKAGRMAIEALQDGWIPVSERLPEDDALMIVTFKPNRPDEGDVWIGWHEMENVWFIDGEEHSKEHGNEVIAWQPLPAPYKESDSE